MPFAAAAAVQPAANLFVASLQSWNLVRQLSRSAVLLNVMAPPKIIINDFQVPSSKQVLPRRLENCGPTVCDRGACLCCCWPPPLLLLPQAQLGCN